MASKSTSRKTSPSDSSKKKSLSVSKVSSASKVSQLKKTQSVVSQSKKTQSTPTLTPNVTISQDMYTTNRSWRIYLKEPKKYAEFPDLLLIQKIGFQSFVQDMLHSDGNTRRSYLSKLFHDISPIEDIAWEKLSLEITELELDFPFDEKDPQYFTKVDHHIIECKKRELTYGGIIKCHLKLIDRTTKEVLLDTKKTKNKANIWVLPILTRRWSYIINGIERVIISQIVRSYGLFYSYNKKDLTYSCKLVPELWSRFEVIIEKSGNTVARINKSRKFSIISLMRVLWFESDESILECFKDVFEEDDFQYIKHALKKDNTTDAKSAAVNIYSKLRPGEMIDPDSAIDYIKSIFADPKKIYVGTVARRKINVKLKQQYTDMGTEPKTSHDTDFHLRDEYDIIASLRYLFCLANDRQKFYTDDPDHLTNKRVRLMGEILYSHLSPLMRKFEKSVKGKLSVLQMTRWYAVGEFKTGEEKKQAQHEWSDSDNLEDDFKQLDGAIILGDICVVKSGKTSRYHFIERIEDSKKPCPEPVLLALRQEYGYTSKDKIEIIVSNRDKIDKDVIKMLKAHREEIGEIKVRPQFKIVDIVNFKMIDNSIKSFFATSQLSQFLDQVNPLAEVEHKRRITALGNGGLKRETAKFEVRDVHPSHYGRICPIETPEWQNIGLVIYQSLYSRINEDGFLETPALKLHQRVPLASKDMIGKIFDDEDFEWLSIGTDKNKIVIKKWDEITPQMAEALISAIGKKASSLDVYPYFDPTEKVEYISPEYDEQYYIADISAKTDKNGNLIDRRIPARHYVHMEDHHRDELTHIDVNPSQIFSPNTCTIPFINHNEASRAQIATAQQKQAVPLLRNEPSLVGTGLEEEIAQHTYAVIKAEWDGEVIYVWGKQVGSDKKTDKSNHYYTISDMDYVIRVQYQDRSFGKNGIKEYNLFKFIKSNQKSVIHQHPVVSVWQKVRLWDILAEGPSVINGELALGTNLRIGYMSREWYNFEDSIIISQRLVKKDKLTSINIEEYELEVTDTKLGPEETTNDIPGVSLGKLKNLDENGIIRIGSVVKGGDILIGKITPKNEWELSPEEKLIQAIFWDKSKSYKDTSLYLPSGSEGKVIDVIILDSKSGDNLVAWVKNKIKVYVAMTRKIEVGDKLTGRHGNKGIVSIVVPEEDMPYTADGQPLDIVLNPLGIPSRLNLGQLFEVQLWLVAKALGVRFAIPPFSGFDMENLRQLSQDAGLPQDGRMFVYDGRTGEQYPNKITVGYMHILKLVHMVEDKLHARSVGPYSLITQQPLGGKSRDGGQRFGEMEVWALEWYSAVHTLQEMLTIKSDDVIGRNKTYEAIVKGHKVKLGGVPESFNLVTNLFKGLCQNIIPLGEEEVEELHHHRLEKIRKLGLSSIVSREGLEESITQVDPEKDKEEKTSMIETIVEDLTNYGQME
jgi:DNA-directed RNA polymerase subunit beta